MLCCQVLPSEASAWNAQDAAPRKTKKMAIPKSCGLKYRSERACMKKNPIPEVIMHRLVTVAKGSAMLKGLSPTSRSGVNLRSVPSAP